MSSQIATAAIIAGIAVLFSLERQRDIRTSPALWLPIVWMFFGASRMLSQWLAGELSTGTLDLYVEGSPMDRNFLSALLAAALAVLIARANRTGSLLRANGPLVLFFLYCAVSVLWSDYPMVAFKRWTKAVGNVAMVLIVVTDPDPVAAVKRFFARTGFLLIPLSVLFIKYYPELGRYYNRWTWEASSVGVATDKNGLGALCMVFGLASLWRFVEAFEADASRERRRALVAHGAILAMAAWLFVKADSSTSLACFVLGGMVILYTMRSRGQRPANVNAIALLVVIVPLSMILFQEMYTYLVQGLGRNTTLTGRTELWSDLFRMNVNPWLGTGFESFWLGPRAAFFWNKYTFNPNQAHNGYIETDINLGLFGVGFLVLLIVSGYRNVVHLYRRDPAAASLRLTFFLIALVYSLTEAAFKVMNPLWIAFLLAVTAVPPLPHRKDKRAASAVKVPFAGPRRPVGAAAPAGLPVT
jgi:exopolysaccharide production protein ExoQ